MLKPIHFKYNKDQAKEVVEKQCEEALCYEDCLIDF